MELEWGCDGCDGVMECGELWWRWSGGVMAVMELVGHALADSLTQS